MNPNDYSLADLGSWDERITELVEKFGLNPFPQDFMICDWEDMIGYMSYSGMPSHYPHWSYGKASEKIRTTHKYGVSGLPYEMVINSNPSIAYLMKGNTLLLQVLTMAHVYGHSDFFRNNTTFAQSLPELTVERTRVHANRVREYMDNPTIGFERVEKVIDSAHSIALQCRRNLSIKKLTRSEQEERVRERFMPNRDEYEKKGIHKSEEVDEEGLIESLKKNPIEPEEDILLVVRDHNRHLSEWEKDLLTIVHEDSQYFIPQIETKIMNEGWASFWHKRILDTLHLPEGMKLEFMVHHNQVLSPHPGGLNPYHVGFTIWDAIDVWDRGSRDASLLNEDFGEHLLYEELTLFYKEHGSEPKFSPLGVTAGNEQIFLARSADRDQSFLRRFLSLPLMKRLGMFEFEKENEEYIISELSDEEGWKKIRDTLISNVGMGSTPVIKVEDTDYSGDRILYLKHYFDGRDLEAEFAAKTLGYVRRLWGREVVLETKDGDENILLSLREDGELNVKRL
jgi:stage V sporulation protein R